MGVRGKVGRRGGGREGRKRRSEEVKRGNIEFHCTTLSL